MNKRTVSILPSILRYFALFCLSLLCYPLIHLYLDCLLHVPNEWAAIQLQLFSTACCLAGFALRSLLQKIKWIHTIWLYDFLAYLLGLIPAGIMLIAANHGFASSIHIAWLAALFQFLPWILGVRSQGKSYDEVVHHYAYITYVVLSVIALCIYSYQYFQDKTVQFPTMSFIIPLLLMTAAYGAALNQGNLDLMMERRGHDFSQLPPKIRRYNIRLFCIVLAIVCLLLVFQQPIIWFFQSIFELLRSFFAWLSQVFVIEKPPTTEEELELLPKPKPQPGLQGEGSAWWNLFGVIVTVSVIIAVICNRYAILEGLSELLQKIQSAFLRLMSHSQRLEKKDEESEYYVDEDTILDSSQKQKKELTPKQRQRAWKKQKRKFQKMPDSPEKIRFGYGLAIEGMQLLQFSLLPSETPLEIEKKYQHLLHQAVLSNITPAYNEIRYGELNLPESICIQELQKLLDELENRKALPV